MTGNQDIAARTATWAGDLLEALKPAVEDCVTVVTDATLTAGDIAGAERKARAIGVIARSVRAIVSLAPKPSRRAEMQEDDMIDHDRDDSPENLDRIRAELECRLNGLRAVIESKRLACEQAGRRTSHYEDDALRVA